ncbi:MAG TPA: hypothetical protein VMO81_14150, partial [Aestuariivirgaceae bacterium]|nr:hypothetical protein [Aestuariivirgaceae bacterium]
ELEDGQRLAGRHGADGEQVAGMIVDQAGEVATAAAGGAGEVERALQVWSCPAFVDTSRLGSRWI